MSRHVYIIKGHSNNASELQMDRYYVQQFARYFGSNAGGAYERNEINTVEAPMAADLEQLLTGTLLDFAVVVLIGHGATQQNRQLFQLNLIQVIRAGQIETGAAKQLIILESCRSQIANVLTVDLNNQIPKFKYGGMVRTAINHATARQLYDRQLAACADGTVVCFACSNNQSAWNYYFSASLLQTAFNWHLGPGPHLQTLPVTTVFPQVATEVAQLAVNNNGEHQTPELLGALAFPFAVSKF